MVRAKTPQRVVLVSDVSGLAGLPPGRYVGSGGEVDILADGRLVVAGQDQLLAGACAPIGTGVANLVRYAGVDLATAIDLAGSRPAALVGFEAGALRPGGRADFVLVDAEQVGAGRLDIRATIVGGQVMHGSLDRLAA
jgi:N-acetylglucosamine-6-phosphate deacetylase